MPAGLSTLNPASACSLARHQSSGSCSAQPGRGVDSGYGTSQRAITSPSSATASALTAVVPTSSPTSGAIAGFSAGNRLAEPGLGRQPRIDAIAARRRLGEHPAEQRRLLEQIVTGCEEDPVGAPDRDTVLAPWQVGDPAVDELRRLGCEAGQRPADVGASPIGERRQLRRIEERAVVADADGLAEPDRIAAVAGQRRRVHPDLSELAAAVLEAGHPRRGGLHVERQPDVRRQPDRERESHTFREARGLPSGAYDDALVLGAVRDTPYFDAAAGASAHGDDLTDEDRVAQPAGQRRDRGAGA